MMSDWTENVGIGTALQSANQSGTLHQKVSANYSAILANRSIHIDNQSDLMLQLYTNYSHIIENQSKTEMLIIQSGVTTGDGNVGGTTVVDTGLTEGDNFWNGNYLAILTGDYEGQVREIADFDATSDTITVHSAFGGQIVDTTPYVILPGIGEAQLFKQVFTNESAQSLQTSAAMVRIAVNTSMIAGNMSKIEILIIQSGTTTASGNAGATTIVDVTLTEGDDYWNGNRVTLLSGSSQGQVREIADFASGTDTITVHSAFDEVVAQSVRYAIIPGIGEAQLFKQGFTNESELSDQMSTGHDLIETNISDYSLVAVSNFSVRTANFSVRTAQMSAAVTNRSVLALAALLNRSVNALAFTTNHSALSLQQSAAMVRIAYNESVMVSNLSKLEILIIQSGVTTASGNAGATTIIDTTLEEANDYWNGNYITLLSGSSQGQVREIADFDAAADTITVHSAFIEVVAQSVRYAILPGIGQAQLFKQAFTNQSDIIATVDANFSAIIENYSAIVANESSAVGEIFTNYSAIIKNYSKMVSNNSAEMGRLYYNESAIVKNYSQSIVNYSKSIDNTSDIIGTVFVNQSGIFRNLVNLSQMFVNLSRLDIPILYEGAATSTGTASEVVDTGLTQGEDFWEGNRVVILDNAYAGQVREIAGFTTATDTLDVVPNFDGVITSGTLFGIIPGVGERKALDTNFSELMSNYSATIGATIQLSAMNLNQSFIIGRVYYNQSLVVVNYSHIIENQSLIIRNISAIQQLAINMSAQGANMSQIFWEVDDVYSKLDTITANLSVRTANLSSLAGNVFINYSAIIDNYSGIQDIVGTVGDIETVVAINRSMNAFNWSQNIMNWSRLVANQSMLWANLLCCSAGA